MRRAGAFAALLCAAFSAMVDGAAAGPAVPYCTIVQAAFGCTPPSAPQEPEAVDPGGSETTPVPVPPPARAFGFSANMAKDDPVLTPAAEASAAVAAGASAHRLAITWKWLQYHQNDPPLPSSYEGDAGQILQHIDERYAAIVAGGLRPVMHVSGAPLWASRFAACSLYDLSCREEARKAANWAEHGYYFPDSAHLPAFRALHRALAKRYPQAIFEGWNEPNLYYDSPPDRSYEPWAPGPEEFKRIHCEAYWAVKSVDPIRTVIAPSFLYRGWPHFADYVNRVFAAGGAGCWDAFNTHVYFSGSTRFDASTTLAKVLASVRRMKSHWTDPDPIWITETGWPTTAQQWWGAPWLTPAAHAEASGRLYNRLMTMPDVAGVFFYTLRDRFRGSSYDPEANYGFLAGDLSPKPAFCGFVGRAGRAYRGC